MSTAAERAVEVIRAALAHNACCEECAVLPDAPWAVDARLARAALMADPDLLVDLAIEAGGLEPWGAWLTAARCNHDAREWCPVKEHTETPLYRRASDWDAHKDHGDAIRAAGCVVTLSDIEPAGEDQ